MANALTVFGDRCRTLRVSRELTMGDQAEALKISASEISAIETGEKRPTADYIRQLSEWLELEQSTRADLISIAMRRDNVVPFPTGKADGIKLFRKVGSLRPEQIRELARSRSREV